MAPRKRKEPAPVTSLVEQQAVEAAHAAELAANTVVDPAGSSADTPDDEEAARAQYRSEAATEANPAAPIVQAVAESTVLPPDEPSFDPQQLDKQPFAKREQERRADPFHAHAFHFPDGYRITYQESDSRHTCEIQFGDGSRADQPQNFEAIKPFLVESGLRWNGTNAWVSELRQPPKFRRESHAEREDRVAENASIRAHVENVVLPTVVSLEEEKRGEIELTDDTRQRIAKAVGHGR